MINLLPEPKHISELSGFTKSFKRLALAGSTKKLDFARLEKTAKLRFWNYRDIAENFAVPAADTETLTITVIDVLPELPASGETSGTALPPPEKNDELFKTQGYCLEIQNDSVTLCFESYAGFINGITSLKQLIVQDADHRYKLPLCTIKDYPSIPVRAVAPTFSWYAGYGRIGFDSQLWGFDEWAEFLNVCLDNKINQFNMILYGYWPFELKNYPETVFRNIPLKIWNAENAKWLTVRYTHPNLEEPFLARFIELAHFLEVKIFAYVGLNSYNGGYTIKHPEARPKAPKTGEFLNDFDSLCLSHPGTVDYILESMSEITGLGFDGFTLEESEEGFWYCECEGCGETWHKHAASPGEAKHKANIWLLNKIYETVRKKNPDAVIGIRAFRQPPLEKDPAFLKECVDSMPSDIMLFWAPALYVPETEFPKWCNAFGRNRIWARDTESNSITSTMGRLYRTFESNMIRYKDEANVQVVERDIEQHIGSVKMGVHGINGFMFEWYGLFIHLFAHGNYGWGSLMPQEEFFKRACELNFGAKLGEKILYVMKNIITIHESQIPLYTTPFPFQKNKMTAADIPAIKAAQANHPKLLAMIDEIREAVSAGRLKSWLPHFDKLKNAERRNAVIYELVLAALRYEDEKNPAKKDSILDEILALNEQDFAIAKEMFFDINPVGETGVKSCMFPYHEMKRLIHNIRHPESPDNDIICSGIEALGWLWL
jgi:hypothetical protein